MLSLIEIGPMVQEKMIIEGDEKLTQTVMSDNRQILIVNEPFAQIS